jgi:tetratricopeptide (TPR) repeat protein
MMSAAVLAALLSATGPSAVRVARADDPAPAPAPEAGPPKPGAAELKLEMAEFASDLRQSRSYREDALEKALKPFGPTRKAPATSEESLKLMAVALAEVDREFRAGWKPFSAGKFDEAVTIWKEQLNPNRDEISYRMALTRYWLGEAYRGQGLKLEAIFEYRSLAEKMPGAFSPAGMSRYRAGKCFEEMNRLMRATEEWTLYAKNYSSGDAAKAEEVDARLKEWGGQYGKISDILGNAAGRMKDIKGDLGDKLDSGRPVQDKQHKVLGLLDDLILTLEEKEKEKDCNGQGPGGGQGNGNSPGSPNGPPSGPAGESRLPEGATAGVGDIRPTRNANAGEGWGNLPVRERERILQAIKLAFPDRYNEIIKDYLRSIGESDASAPKPEAKPDAPPAPGK